MEHRPIIGQLWSTAISIDVATRDELERLAWNRNRVKIPHTTRKRDPNWRDEKIHELGLLGEYAFATYFGLELDRRIIPMHGDPGPNFTWRGQTVTVKYRHLLDAWLYVDKNPRDDVDAGLLINCPGDVIVLTHGTCFSKDECFCYAGGDLVVTLAGWLTREEFIERCELLNPGNIGWKYVVKPRRTPLHPIEDLLEPPTDDETPPDPEPPAPIVDEQLGLFEWNE